MTILFSQEPVKIHNDMLKYLTGGIKCSCTLNELVIGNWRQTFVQPLGPLSIQYLINSNSDNTKHPLSPLMTNEIAPNLQYIQVLKYIL